MSYGVPIPTLAQRLIRMGPPALNYHLERVQIASVDGGLRWMREWSGPDGVRTWVQASDAARRRAIRYWRFLRHLHRSEWQQRGGIDV